jgi:hypothetical protein
MSAQFRALRRVTVYEDSANNGETLSVFVSHPAATVIVVADRRAIPWEVEKLHLYHEPEMSYKLL